MLSWQAGNASGPFLTGTMIQGLLMVNDPTYSPTAWQGTLFIFAVTLLMYVINIYAHKTIPLISNLFLVLHILGFLVIVIVLWVLAPHQSAHNVFVNVQNSGGWSNKGVSIMVGQISAIFGLLSKCTSLDVHTSNANTDQAPTQLPTWLRRSRMLAELSLSPSRAPTSSTASSVSSSSSASSSPSTTCRTRSTTRLATPSSTSSRRPSPSAASTPWLPLSSSSSRPATSNSTSQPRVKPGPSPATGVSPSPTGSARSTPSARSPPTPSCCRVSSCA